LKALFFYNKERDTNDTFLYIPRSEKKLFSKIMENEKFQSVTKVILTSEIKIFDNNKIRPKGLLKNIFVLFKCVLDSKIEGGIKHFDTAILVWNSATPPGAQSFLQNCDFYIQPEERKKTIIVSKTQLDKKLFYKFKTLKYGNIFGSRFKLSLSDFFKLYIFFVNYLRVKKNFRIIFPEFIGTYEYVRMIYGLLKWSFFVNEVQVKQLVAYNSWSLIDCIMIEMCRLKGIKTLCYLHSFSENDLLSDASPNVARSYMSYDKICVRRNSQISFLVNSGCSPENFIEYRFEEGVIEKLSFLDFQRPIVSIFLPSWGSTEQLNNTQSIYAGLIELERLVDIYPNIIFYIKSKFQNLSADEILSLVASRLSLKDNVRFVENDLYALSMIKSSDLVISLAITSCSIEALCCGVPSVFLNASGWQLAPLTKVENFVRASANELKHDIEKFCLEPNPEACNEHIQGCLRVLMDGNTKSQRLVKIIRSEDLLNV
jgi:hypothetical protein